VTITGTASDTSGIYDVQIYVDGLQRTPTSCSSGLSTTCTWSSTYAAGTHTYYVISRDTAGNTGRDPTSGTKSFTVTQADTTPPALTLTLSPLTAVFLTTDVTITAIGSDANGVQRVDIFVDDNLAKSCTAFSCTLSATYSSGTHTYYAVAYDTAGNMGRGPASGTKSFTVQQPDTTPPSVSISYSPTANINTATTITLDAKASDAGGVANVTIFVDGSFAKFCSLATSCALSATYPAGTHTYYATAVDSAGNTARDPATGAKSFTVAQGTDAVNFTNATQILCTADVQLCPDGVTYVRRVPPTCAFIQCPLPQTLPISISSSSSLAGTAGQYFGATFGISGGTPPYTWVQSAGVLPPGLQLQSQQVPCGNTYEGAPPCPLSEIILLAGTPTQAGTYTFAISATDSAGATGKQVFTVSVAPPATGIKKVTTDDLFDIAFRLEKVRANIDSLQRNARSLAAYYDSVGDTESAQKFGAVVDMFEQANGMVDSIKAKIRSNLGDPDAIIGELRADISRLQDFLQQILIVLISADDTAQAGTAAGAGTRAQPIR
jgi:hypothetical protein